MNRKRIVVLGATGSIGQSAAKVARDIPERMRIVGIAANTNARQLAEQANELRPEVVCIVDESKVGELRGELAYTPRVLTGEGGLIEIAQFADADMVLIAIVGTGGLRPALAAIAAGKDLAIASKEILVMAGEIVMREARAKGVHVLPVDSEHNAIFQCLECGRGLSAPNPIDRGAEAPPTLNSASPTLNSSNVRRLILTASGGPFRQTPREQFAGITREQALKHPTWNMGPKITIDSATLFNKGLEMIEARWLFDVQMARVEVIVHPQSIVHSMVEFIDGSVLAQLSHSDMCFPIQYAVTWPERVPNSLRPLDFGALAKLEFFEPRADDFPALHLARRAGEAGGTLPAVLNAANEVAVSAFLDGRIKFPQIWETVAAVMDRHASIAQPDLNAILRADLWARDEAAREIGRG